jgi:multiple sugar transport system substrate-binding protein
MLLEPIRLSGMTWNHSRGYTPMVATAQRFCEMHVRPDIQIVWEKRSLQEFADQPIDELAKQYDLLVIDHPWAGFAAVSGVLVPLDEHLPAEFLADQAANSVGRSHESYTFGGHQWALAIDAAAPVPAFRPDLMERAGCALPKTWDEMIALGKRGMVCCPSIPLDTFCNFMNLCASAGAPLFPDDDHVVGRAAGRVAMERLKELASVVPARCFHLNPIATLEVMSREDAFAYCPFTYGYSNYARPGHAAKLVRFGGIVEIERGHPPSTMLGGTGLAISSRCKHLDIAVAYAKFVASPEIQRGIYFQSGGQPGHRAAWLDDAVNAASSNYFQDTLPTLDRAFVRPRYAGFLEFQDRAGDPIYQFLREGGNADQVLDTLDELYRKHRGATR